MSNIYPRPTCSAVAVATGSHCNLAHGTDQPGSVPLVPAASVSPPTTTTQCQPSTRPVRPGRKSFAEALYRALLRLAPTRKAQIQAVFRFFKVRTELSHNQVQQVLISALGLELVREAWTEARKEINEHVQAEVAYMLRPMGSSSGTAPSSPSSSTTPSVSSPTSTSSPTSSAHATTMALLQWQQQRQQNQQQRQEQAQPEAAATLTRPRPLGGEEEEEARRVRPRTLMPMPRPMQPRAMLPRQSTMFWRAGEAMPSATLASTTGASAAAQEDVGISIVLASLSCPPHSPPLQRADRSHSQDSITSTNAAAARAAAAMALSSSSSAASRSIFCATSIAVSVDDGESELEDEDILLQDAPNAFVCPISLQLMTRAVVAGDGFSYQREALDKWILRNRRERKPLRSPMTNAPMAPFYTPSFTLRSMVGDFVDLERAKRRREGGVAHVVED